MTLLAGGSDDKSISRKRKRMDVEESRMVHKRRHTLESKFLELPHDIHHIIINEFLDTADILSLAHTSNAFRYLCYDLYLQRQSVIQKNASPDIHKRRITMRINKYTPRLALLILMSSLRSNHFAQVHACLWIDLDPLYHFQNMMFNFLENSQLIVTGLSFLYTPQTLQTLSSEVPSLMMRLLASVGASCTFFYMWENPQFNAVTTTINSFGHHLDSNHINVDAIRPAMDGIVSMDLPLSFFDSPTIRTLAPHLLQGSSITSLVLSCSKTATLQDILNDVKMPAVSTMVLLVLSDVTQISFPTEFFHRHQSLQRLTLTNGCSNPVNHIAQGSILELPPLRTVTISSNYSGWRMSDQSLLASVSINPTNYRCAHNGVFCDEVRLLVGAVSQYQDTSPKFPYCLTFPGRIRNHVKLHSQNCTCFPKAHDQLAVNVHTLVLKFTRIMGTDSPLKDWVAFSSYISKWLKWFPDLKSLQITYMGPSSHTPNTELSLAQSLKYQSSKDLQTFQCGTEENYTAWYFQHDHWIPQS
ncbi:hypothetical protein JR316_0008316 [Psilocybe cubensis]|uniref:Uncharacterized protein n=2 Tax=Psilocybe cubensis TaxID=181762 RepID=A0ACB8GVR7_PSICU|nr:hypothetical protein JR316_0008316 [Psilocybe cubensis]KAH9479721.1 hypothetical protein JR316_0008316 [Psilocybe cubensis]